MLIGVQRVRGMPAYDYVMTAEIADKLKNGSLVRWCLYDETALKQAVDVIRTAEQSGIETLRLVFPDQHGVLRGKTISLRAMSTAFTDGLGVPSTLLLKDTSHRTVFDVWNGASGGDTLLPNGASDLLMVPLPSTYRVTPWSPHSAIVLCDLVYRSGQHVSFSSRAVLRQAIDQLKAFGYIATFGLEVEFQVFERLDDSLDHAQASMPPSAIRTRNLTQGWQYLTETRYGEVEDLLDTLRRFAEAMGLAPRTMEIEMGPSQFEFTFEPSDPLAQADRYVLFRAMVKEVCRQRGLHASFMAKPKLPNAAANGWHIHQSLRSVAYDETGVNVFMPDTDGELTREANGWIAGLLTHAEACCLLTTPTVNGYKRYAPYQLAPNRIQWARDNRGAMLRALMFPHDSASRIENRAPDTTANPYFAFAAQLIAGLDGIRQGLQAPAMTESPYGDDARRLPASLAEAIDAFEASALFNEALGEEFVNYLVHIKRAEWQRYLGTISEWEQAEYFGLF